MRFCGKLRGKMKDLWIRWRRRGLGRCFFVLEPCSVGILGKDIGLRPKELGLKVKCKPARDKRMQYREKIEK